MRKRNRVRFWGFSTFFFRNFHVHWLSHFYFYFFSFFVQHFHVVNSSMRSVFKFSRGANMFKNDNFPKILKWWLFLKCKDF